jgi:hypothetical protein
MILKHLLLGASNLPDMDTEVVLAEEQFESLQVPTSIADLENLTVLSVKTFVVEAQNRSVINLNIIEGHIVKSKHYVGDDEDDFV